MAKWSKTSWERERGALVNLNRVFYSFSLVPLLALAWLGAAGAPAPNAAVDQENAAFFEKKIRPLFVARCIACHGPQRQQNDLRLDAPAFVLKGGTSGPALVSGDPDHSLIVQCVRYTGPIKMPPAGRLKEEEITDLTTWVKRGAPWPASPAQKPGGAPGASGLKPWWSFLPVKRPAVPRVKNTAWVKTPIDAFVLAKLEARGIRPVPSADRRTLIRRATFDLTGLPPTPEEIEAFLKDRTPNAFATVVDRLLASSAYGERWGRHWLDVVRYADTAGETADYPVPDAYRYRNYVIDSFNQDKPYNVFLQEQIAGDILAQNGPRTKYAERVVATGYLAISRRFGFDPQNYQNLMIDDTMDTLGRSVLGLSIGCARCHDHKFDPISSRDYYGLYGVFDSTKYAFSGAEETKRQRDLVPMIPPQEADALMKPFLAKQTPTAPVIEKAYAVSEGSPHNAHILKRGDAHDPGEEAPRRFLTALGGQELPRGTVGSGRLELAEWLTKPTNPLTARVVVNRIWQYHFGKGIVPTPNDFGKRGQPPTHPELLDYLASEFVRNGWSFKKMHRLIVLSETYQTACAESATNAKLDPHNDLMWKTDRRRLDAESIRDSILAASGSLDRTMGGPHPFPPEASWNFTQHEPFQAVYETNRRSVYLMVQRNRRHPFLSLFDGADPNASTGVRSVTTVPTQALFFMNDPFIHREADHLADRLLHDCADDDARIRLATLLMLGRNAAPAETLKVKAYLQQYQQEAGVAGITAQARAKAAWASYARILFSSNAFLYVE